jgi:hypothetical protein
MDINYFLQQLWQDYTQIAPQAKALYQGFIRQGEQPVNDHVAFRTLNLSPVNLASLEPYLLELGYQPFESYEFPQKKLKAWSYLPNQDQLPKIFFSELLTEQLSTKVQAILNQLVNSIDSPIQGPQVFYSGRLWPAITLADYQQLLAESEYAAWVAAFGLRANHFTIAVHRLKHMNSLAKVLDWVNQQGYRINQQGRTIKGSAEVLLAQAATIAEQVDVDFADGQRKIPSCFYEFAYRYPDSSGKLFQGFVTHNADKIFSSTHVNS